MFCNFLKQFLQLKNCARTCFASFLRDFAAQKLRANVFWEDTKTPDANPPNKRFVLIFGYILEITLWKYVSITYFRDSIWLKYDQNTLMRLISKPWISLKSIRILDKTPEHMGQVINWPLPKAEIWKCRFPTFRWCKIQKNVYVNESFQRLGLISNINKRFLYWKLNCKLAT